jgi:hypothetical protein
VGLGDVGAAPAAAGITFDADGLARGSRVYVVVDETTPIGRIREVTAHEALHVLQYALASGRSGSTCIQEGAATWVGLRVRNEMTGVGATRSFHGELDRTKEGLSRSRVLPSLSSLATYAQFHGPRGTLLHSFHYQLCTLAFDLIIRTEGGEVPGTRAYFAYLTEMRTVGWQVAFDRAFSEDLASFERRFDAYRASGFTEHRFPEEIEAERRAFGLFGPSNADPVVLPGYVLGESASRRVWDATSGMK